MRKRCPKRAAACADIHADIYAVNLAAESR
jgi:hypothetical protein